jgi:deoxyribodipyrimidine photo-lyase
MKSLYWLRNDLRMQDNRSLDNFCKNADSGLVVWCPTKSFLRADVRRKNFILSSLMECKKNIEMLGGKLIIFKKTITEVLPKFIADNEVDSIFYSSEPTPEEIREESHLKEIVNLSIFSAFQGSLIHIDDLGFDIINLPPVFTQFRNLVEADLKVQTVILQPSKMPKPFLPILVTDQWDIQTELNPHYLHPKLLPGEAEGLKRMNEYIFLKDRLKTYKETRNGMLNWDDSSKLSAWLSIGAISARQIYASIQKYENERCKNESTYWLKFELLWRDYFRLNALLKQEKLFNQRSSVSANPDEQYTFGLWCNGKTGVTFIDANMIELNLTGWMSNRGRQNVASYLAKILKVDWRWGAAYFENKLIDYDASSNWGNWAYLAGVGQDPRNRTFNPDIQANRYDKDGEYQKLWISKQ